VASSSLASTHLKTLKPLFRPHAFVIQYLMCRYVQKGRRGKDRHSLSLVDATEVSVEEHAEAHGTAAPLPMT